MGYELGVDLGTTYTAAATHRDGSTQIVELGNQGATIPSVVFLTEEETILVGDAANRRATTNPARVAREFKRRIGDPTPLFLGGSPYSAESLSARLLEWVIGQVTSREGEAPTRVAVTHPANWGPYKLDLLHQAFRMADLEQVVTLTEPEAAAIHYATLERIDPGMTVAVFDLGGGTFDAAILRKRTRGFDFLGRPEGIERLGGIDFDAAVFGFIRNAIGSGFDSLDADDPTVMAAVARLRRDCVDAKEALSGDTEAVVPVVLPGLHTDIRLTRAEFEQMIRPSLADSIGAMHRAVRSADLTIEDIDLVLLVGGSSRIPLVGQMVGSELGRPVAVDAHPKHSVALGAARAAADSAGAHLAAVTTIGGGAGLVGAGAGLGGDGGADGGPPPAGLQARPPDEPEGDRSWGPPATGTDPAPAPAPALGGLAPAAAMAGGAPPATPPEGDRSWGPPATASDPAPAPNPYAQPSATGATAMAGTSLAGFSAGGAGPGPDGPLDNEFPMASVAPGRPPRSNLLVVLGVVAVVMVVGAVLANSFLGGDDGLAEGQGIAQSDEGEAAGDGEADEEDPDAEEPPASTATSEATTTTAGSTTTEPPFTCDGLCAHVDEVVVGDDGELTIYWDAYNYEPSTSNFHAHFYFDIYEAEQVGSNWAQNGAESQGSWHLTDEIPFSTAGTGVAIADRPAGATQLCVVAADSGHGVVNPENAECFHDLP